MNSAHGYTEGADVPINEMRAAQESINLSWIKIRSMIDGARETARSIEPKLQVPIYTIHWNHHTWTFTSEEESWLFAHYWKLV